MNQQTDTEYKEAALPSSGRLAWKILLPVLIGVAVVVWLFSRDFNVAEWNSIHFDTRVILCICLAWLFMIGRDFGLSWRFRELTDRQLSWKSSIKINMLCEFTSCVTPTAVGGSAFGMLYLNREGIELGRATTLMMTTLFLDELFFVVACPVALMLVSYADLFGFGDNSFDIGIQTVFWIVYGVICIWTFILFMGIIVKPKSVRKILNWLFHFRWLRRWQASVDQLGANMEQTGRDLSHRSAWWWIRAFGATALSWSSRFMVVNALFLAFAPGASQLVVLMRQLIVWVVLMASPTPGGSGLSEWLFTTYYGDMIPAGMALVIALFWRIISYYVYLIIGACIVPGWLSANYRKMKQAVKSNSQNNE